MDSRRSLAEAAIRKFLKGANKDPDAGLDTPLFAEDGLGLDSLETAELSAVLEDALGQDPFSEGDMPQTLAAVLDFYREAVADAAL
jgi:acyl carrier protein